MKSKHIPGPWFVAERFGGLISEGIPRTEIGAQHPGNFVQDPGLCKVADVYNHNAERIVECVNACEGIEFPSEIRDALNKLHGLVESAANELRAISAQGDALWADRIRDYAQDVITKADSILDKVGIESS